MSAGSCKGGTTMAGVLSAVRPSLALLPVSLALSRSGLSKVSAGRVVSITTSSAELVAALRDRQQRSPDTPVVISGDKDVRYDAVLKVMDELQRATIRRVGLMVKPAAR